MPPRATKNIVHTTHNSHSCKWPLSFPGFIVRGSGLFSVHLHTSGGSALTIKTFMQPPFKRNVPIPPSQKKRPTCSHWLPCKPNFIEFPEKSDAHLKETTSIFAARSPSGLLVTLRLQPRCPPLPATAGSGGRHRHRMGGTTHAADARRNHARQADSGLKHDKGLAILLPASGKRFICPA